MAQGVLIINGRRNNHGTCMYWMWSMSKSGKIPKGFHQSALNKMLEVKALVPTLILDSAIIMDCNQISNR